MNKVIPGSDGVYNVDEKNTNIVQAIPMQSMGQPIYQQQINQPPNAMIAPGYMPSAQPVLGVLPIPSAPPIVIYPEHVTGEASTWATNLFECGNICTCCYAFICPSCASAQGKALMDGSNCIVTCCCFSLPVQRWLMRTAYGIPGNAHWDCWTSLFCPCCVANQMLQTAYQKGRASSNVGPEFNNLPRKGCQGRAYSTLCYDFFYVVCCPVCASGLALQSAGLPFWFGCLCTNPFAAMNILRYHNHIKPCLNWDAIPDCIVPIGLYAATTFTFGVAGSFAAVCYNFTNLVEENQRFQRDGCYGCSYGLCLSDCVHWCRTCSCSAPEGRYLHQAIKRI